ncbi:MULTISPECIES: PTS sugar transporter subunit IIB [Streptomyces]|uniref:PTS sugar transporter subunit IIB n=1 Tax=Streptomyces celluloflavus TaxID=58344 RepID=A0ABW7RN12_9ACTN|nr:PTS sugar transporter subunit IIB [Streptomyces sp. SID7805]MYU56665.1 PTS lactose transporter subunit IIB [Streptomyces sp. SID7805]WSK10397.1 PTS sugar transporter subunit IIB [Streptomyces celluloflavus]WSK17169.1 PTS sugar transporter subunit IIB [Streptomyces celluloflavus]
MKIMAMCSTGLGSSFMLRMNIEDVVKELGLRDVQVEHSDLSSASPTSADAFFVAKDLEDAAQGLGDVTVMDSLIDKDELRAKVKALAERHALV